MRTRQLLFIVAIPFCVVSLGAIGYWVIEDLPFLDALYMSVITLTTVGYGEVHPLGQAGRAFTMVFLLGGVFTLFYAATEVVRAVVSGEIATVFGRQRMQWSLADMKDHLVVCGFGRMGRLVCEQFSALRLPFVVVGRDASLLKDFQMPNGIPLTGDATSESDVLRQAGVERARGLVSRGRLRRGQPGARALRPAPPHAAPALRGRLRPRPRRVPDLAALVPARRERALRSIGAGRELVTPGASRASAQRGRFGPGPLVPRGGWLTRK